MRNTQNGLTPCILLCARRAAHFLFESLCCSSVASLTVQAQAQCIQTFLNRYLLISRIFMITRPIHNIGQLERMFHDVCEQAPEHFKEWFDNSSTLSHILFTLNSCFLQQETDDVHDQFAYFRGAIQYLFRNRKDYPNFLSHQIYNSLKRSSYGVDILAMSQLIPQLVKRESIAEAEVDRAYLAIEALRYYCIKSKAISQLALYKYFVRIVKELYYFDEATCFADIQDQQLRQQKLNELRREQLTYLETGLIEVTALIDKKDKFNGFLQHLNRIHEIVQEHTGQTSLAAAWVSLMLQQRLEPDLEQTLIKKLNAKKNIWAYHANANLSAINAENERRCKGEQPQRTLLEKSIFVFLSFLMLVPIIALLVVTKGGFAAALPWALPKCIAAATAISATIAGVIAAVDPVIHYHLKRFVAWLKHGFKAIFGSETTVENTTTRRSVITDTSNPLYNPDPAADDNATQRPSSRGRDSANLFKSRVDTELEATVATPDASGTFAFIVG